MKNFESQIILKAPLMRSFPPVREIAHRLGDTLREVEILRGLLRLAERVERYRECDAKVRKDRAHDHERIKPNRY